MEKLSSDITDAKIDSLLTLVSVSFCHTTWNNLTVLILICILWCKSVMFFNPEHPNIQMHFLHSVLYTFPKELSREFV